MYVAFSARKTNGEFFTGTDLYLVLDFGALEMKLCEVFKICHLKSSNNTLCDPIGINFSFKMNSLKISFIFGMEVSK